MGGPKRGPKMDPFGVKMGHFRGVPRSEGVPKMVQLKGHV